MGSIINAIINESMGLNQWGQTPLNSLLIKYKSSLTPFILYNVELTGSRKRAKPAVGSPSCEIVVDDIIYIGKGQYNRKTGILRAHAAI